MIGKSILHRLFVTRAGSIYRFTPEVTSCSLCLTDPLMNNWFVVQPVNRITLRPMRGWGPFVQQLESVLKGTTSLLSLKVGRSEFLLTPYVPSYSPSLTPEMGGLLNRRTRATLTHANLRIIPNKQEFIVSWGLTSSYLGHRMKKSVSTVNDIIKWEWFSSWSDLMQYSLHSMPPLTWLHMYNLVITLFISYTKVGRIHSVPRIRYLALSMYYRSFWLYTWTWSALMSLHRVQVIIL